MKTTLQFYHKDLDVWQWENALGEPCLSFADNNGVEIQILGVSFTSLKKQLKQDFITMNHERSLYKDQPAIGHCLGSVWLFANF